MTVRFKQKVRKWRGRTSHGWGAKKKHRGGGSQGGRGFAGLHKHKYTKITTSGSMDYFGFKGFTSLKKRAKALNVGDLRDVCDGKEDVNLTALGYGKLLSRGKADKAYIVKVKSFSKSAKKKIEEAGGKIVS
ncbi:uL15 family ribosomal protein [archaeon]|nr:uL15 family ribosomal protein [archaeon]